MCVRIQGTILYGGTLFREVGSKHVVVFDVCNFVLALCLLAINIFRVVSGFSQTDFVTFPVCNVSGFANTFREVVGFS